jgi:polyhydroxyalkanoate synthesis regulator phasin
MDDLFKKFINTGVGFLSQGNKAVQVAIEKLVKESKISEQEGKKIVDDLLKSSETKRADLEKQFKGLTADLKNRVSSKGQPADAPAPKAKSATAPAAKKPAAKKPVASPAAEAAGTAKKAADKVSAAAGKAQRSAAAKAGAPKKATVQSADDSGEALTAE